MEWNSWLVYQWKIKEEEADRINKEARQGMTPPCKFLTKKRYSVPHQGSQLTEDTEVGGEKEEKRGQGRRMVRGEKG